VGESVTIKKSLLGGYVLHRQEGVTLRVKRVK
jgi:hypothetical protein